MSGYINFYVVPKKTRKKYGYDKEKGNTEEEIEISKGEPLLLFSYSRNSDVYREFNEELNPPYAGMESEKYAEVTKADAMRVVSNFEEDLKGTKERLETEYKMLEKCNSREVFDVLWDDIMSMEKYYKEQQESLDSLRHLAYFIGNVTEYTDFEKVLVNIT